MTEKIPKEDARTIGEIMDEADRISARARASMSNLWNLALCLVILGAMWSLFAMRFAD